MQSDRRKERTKGSITKNTKHREKMEPNMARKSGTEKVSESYANLYATKLPACLPASDLCGQDREPGNFHFSASPCAPFLL